MIEYDLDYSRWGKTQVGFIFHQRTDSTLKQLREFNLTVHNITYKSFIICSYSDINFNTEIKGY